jgi:hypothetical protein
MYPVEVIAEHPIEAVNKAAISNAVQDQFGRMVTSK